MYLLSDHENQIQDEKGQKIVKWLSHLNFWSKQDDTFERRQEGTGRWFINDVTFQDWVNGKFNVLWCPGDRKTLWLCAMLILAGVGKTVLTYRISR
jgi:hypothetical protein